MSSYLDIDGVYDVSKRYIVNNWSPEDFSQPIGSETAYNDNKIIEVRPAYQITIKAGEMRELGQFEAFLFTKHFVNREMGRDAQKLTGKDRERAEMGIDNKELRKPYEDKTISEIKPGEATPFMDKIRAEIRAEELAKLKAEVKPETKTKAKDTEAVKEFSDA